MFNSIDKENIFVDFTIFTEETKKKSILEEANGTHPSDDVLFLFPLCPLSLALRLQSLCLCVKQFQPGKYICRFYNIY